MNVAFPFVINGEGRVASSQYEAHIREMIEQVLFTAPGERVNRPTFGCGLLQYVFTNGGGEMAAATQYLVQGALQQWLGELIQVEAVLVVSDDATLRVTVQYIIRASQQRRVEQFAR